MLIVLALTVLSIKQIGGDFPALAHNVENLSPLSKVNVALGSMPLTSHRVYNKLKSVEPVFAKNTSAYSESSDVIPIPVGEGWNRNVEAPPIGADMHPVTDYASIAGEPMRLSERKAPDNAEQNGAGSGSGIDEADMRSLKRFSGRTGGEEGGLSENGIPAHPSSDAGRDDTYDSGHQGNDGGGDTPSGLHPPRVMPPVLILWSFRIFSIGMWAIFPLLGIVVLQMAAEEWRGLGWLGRSIIIVGTISFSTIGFGLLYALNDIVWNP